jgi:hypothetical protein
MFFSWRMLARIPRQLPVANDMTLTLILIRELGQSMNMLWGALTFVDRHLLFLSAWRSSRPYSGFAPGLHPPVTDDCFGKEDSVEGLERMERLSDRMIRCRSIVLHLPLTSGFVGEQKVPGTVLGAISLNRNWISGGLF